MGREKRIRLLTLLINLQAFSKSPGWGGVGGSSTQTLKNRGAGKFKKTHRQSSF